MGEIGVFRRLAKESGRPITISMLQSHVRPDSWRTLLAEIDEANKEGFRITAQVRSRPTSAPLGFERRRTRSWAGRPTRRSPTAVRPNGWPSCASPSSARASWRRRRGRPGASAASTAGTARPRSAIRRTTSRSPRAASPPAPSGKGGRRRRWPTTCCAARRQEMLYLRSPTSPRGNLDVVREMIAAPNTLIGLGDGGAHVGIMCDATATSYTLTHWTRDRGRRAVPGGVGHQAAGGRTMPRRSGSTIAAYSRSG